MVAVIYVGGVGPSTMPTLPFTSLPSSEPSLRVAADAGLDLAVELGEDVDVIIGDLDSVDLDLLAAARDRGVEVREYPPDKDLTDLELAIQAVLENSPGRQRDLVVIGGGGGRLDHLLGVLAALAAATLLGLDVTGYLGDDVVWLVGPGVRLELAAQPGTTVSLMAIGGPATVQRAIGLQWPLSNVTLSPTSAIGVSNCVLSPAVTVEVRSGVVAVIAPAAAADPSPDAAPTGRFRHSSGQSTVRSTAQPSAQPGA